MGNIGFYQDWLLSALFWLGGCITLFGLVLVFLPAYAIQAAHRMDRWISTEAFFQTLDRPHYRERVFYRWHCPLGAVIVLASLYIIYMFVFRTDMDALATSLPLYAEREVNRWLFEALQYFFTSMSIVTLVLGIIIILRPSVLKRLEDLANTWVGVEKPLEKLNSRYEIPENILPGNVRLFGSFVLAGGAYMMISTTRVLA